MKNEIWIYFLTMFCYLYGLEKFYVTKKKFISLCQGKGKWAFFLLLFNLKIYRLRSLIFERTTLFFVKQEILLFLLMKYLEMSQSYWGKRTELLFFYNSLKVKGIVLMKFFFFDLFFLRSFICLFFFLFVQRKWMLNHFKWSLWAAFPLKNV